MINDVVRPLTIADQSQIFDILKSREGKFLYGNMSFDFDTQKVLYENPKNYDKSNGMEILGYIDNDGILDCYMTVFYPPEPSHIAFNILGEHVREQSAFLRTIWSHKNHERKKDQHNFDINFTKLFIDTFKYFENNGIYTSWGLTPDNFIQHSKKNVTFINATLKRYVQEDFYIPANSLKTTEPHADFINKYILQQGTYKMNMTARVTSLKPEFRTP